MKKVKLGIQTYAVREAFAEDPAKTLKMLADMGYECIEITEVRDDERGLDYYVKAIADAGLECRSIITSWKFVLPETIDASIEVFKKLGVGTVVIGSVDFKTMAVDPTYAPKAVELMKFAHEKLKANGFKCGYHAHDGDIKNKVGDVTFYEYAMSNTPEDFQMIEDTGNIYMGGGDPIEFLHKFPGRSPLAHTKGCGPEKGYTTPVWEADLDWDTLIPLFVEKGGTEAFIIEYGARGDYDPIERAQLSFNWLRDITEKYGYR